MKNHKSYLRRIGDATILGGMSAFLMLGLVACGNSSNNEASSTSMQAKKGATVTLEEQSDGSYKILEEVPSTETRVIVKKLDGTEEMLPKEEVDALIAQEAQKVENGTSELTSSSGGGLGIGGAILASAAGAILGSYIGNKLFNNQNYQSNAQRNYSSQQAYQRSASSFNRGGGFQNASTPSSAISSTPSSAKSGFFGGSSSRTATQGSSSFGA